MAEAARNAHGTPRGRGRPKVVDDLTLSARIVDAAGEILVSRGYDETTMDMVAQQAGMSKRTVYRLFSGKQALFAAVASAHRQAMLDLPRDDDDRPLADTLLAIFRADLDPDTLRRHDALVRLMIGESQRHPDLAQLHYQHGPMQSLELLTEWLVRQAALGRIVVVEPRATAHMLMHMIFGPIAFNVKFEPQWPSPSERKPHIVRVVNLFLNGVLPRDPRGVHASQVTT